MSTCRIVFAPVRSHLSIFCPVGVLVGKVLCVESECSLLDPATNVSVPLHSFAGSSNLAFGGNLFADLESDPSALQVLVYVARIVQLCGSPDSVNWVRCPRRNIAKKTKQSTRTITRALEKLTEKGFLIRNNYTQCVYRIPSKFLLVGSFEPVPEPESQDDSVFNVIVPPDEIVQHGAPSYVPLSEI